MTVGQKLLATNWTFLETEVLIGPKPVSYIHWCSLYLGSCKQHLKSSASSAQPLKTVLGDGAKPGASGVSHMQDGVTPPILRALQMPQCWRTSSTPWPPRKNLLWTEWKEMEVPTLYTWASPLSHLTNPVKSCCLSFLNQDIPNKGQDPRVNTLGQTSGNYLSIGYPGQQLVSSEYFYRTSSH